MVGRIIGKNGATVEHIKTLSGALDVKFSERPVGIQGLLIEQRDCTITGSHEQIEDAKKLIQRVIQGEDIVTSALFSALMEKLNITAETNEGSSCTLS
jgi:rRNA processing protein Krr1/Pno1